MCLTAERGKFRRRSTLLWSLLALAGGPVRECAAVGGMIDAVTFGDAASESNAQVVATRSDVVVGGLDQPARRLLPDGATNWEGGRVSFRLAVDPGRTNYATLRLWGGDQADNRLLLLCAGMQVGYRHLGDIDILDDANDEPPLPGRFYYRTTPLPLSLTAGKTSLTFEIRSNGRIWGYGRNFAEYQKPMTTPSRGLYRFYTHTDGFFMPPADEPQGAAPTNAPLRRGPGPEVFDAARERVNHEVRAVLSHRGPLSQVHLWFLARAYQVDWTPAYHDARAVAKVVESLDALCAQYQRDPGIAQREPSTWNPDWFGVGPAAQSVVLLADALAPHLDRPPPGATGTTRRVAWAAIFADCRDGHRAHRRWYTNQSMIIDTYGIYLPNRALAVLQPEQALPEAQALRYLHESTGVVPWLGSEVEGIPQRPLGDGYFQLTGKGLTRELGFVGYYGEVLDWMSAMYDATRPAPGQPGDEQIRAALVKAARARGIFRYPSVDEDGFRAMRAETIVGWRDQDHYPGNVTYLQRPTWDGSTIGAAAASRDPALIGCARQMFDDNQFFASAERQTREGGLRTTIGLLNLPGDYDTVRSVAPGAERLPMADGQPDFAWADEEDGVVAVKDRGDILYVSLYWRARYAINFLARVHHITPHFDRIAVVRQETVFEPSGQTYRRPDWTNTGFGNGGCRYPGGVHSAHAGEELPIAKVPDGLPFRPGDENVYAGKGALYVLRYGPYFIAMNCTTGRTFTVELPPDLQGGLELVSRRAIGPAITWALPPRSTLVMRTGKR